MKSPDRQMEDGGLHGHSERSCNGIQVRESGKLITTARVWGLEGVQRGPVGHRPNYTGFYAFVRTCASSGAVK